MTRAPLTISQRRPALSPFRLFDKEVVPLATGSSRAKLTCGMWHNGILWACSNFVLYKSSDGGHNFVSTENLNSKYSTSGVEGIYISSQNYIYITDLASGKILWNKINPADNTLVNANFAFCKCSDASTDFIFPADIGSSTAGHFNNWSMWEIVNTYELGIEKTKLHLHDIIMGHYHRTSSGKHQRRAFIYVLRGTNVLAVQDATIAASCHKPDPTYDPFPQWNSVQAYVRRHIHNVVIGNDGYLYFSTGDSLISYPITSVSGATPVVVTCAEHGLVTGNIIKISGNSTAAINNVEWTVTKIDVDTFSLNGSVGATHGSGAGGTFAPQVKAGDTAGTYRLNRLLIGSDSWEEIAGDIHGYTVLYKRPDGKILAGNDYGTGYVGGRMTIDLYNGNTLEHNCYSPVARYDSPIWEITREADTGKYFAAIQSMGGAAAGVGIGGLLKSQDGGDTFTPMLFSGSTQNDPNWVNVDRIYTDRRRDQPSGNKNMIIQVQPESGRGEYYIYDLVDTVENKLKALGNMRLWLKADAITGLADGAAVSSWADSSPIGNTATQATAARQPVYKTNILNGLPSVRFDGNTGTTPDYLDITSSSFTSYSIFAVYKCTGTAANPYNALIGCTGGGFYAGGTNANARGPAVYDGTAWFACSAASTTANLIEYRNRNIILNGSVPAYATQRILAGTFAATAIGIRTISDTTAFAGDIHELIIYGEELSQRKRLYVQNYLATKYGLTVGNTTI